MSVNGTPLRIEDIIHAGIRCQLGQTKTLELWRELGGQIRDVDFAQQWRTELERFDQWRREQR